jgi:glycosyltransferase involved in cell wall biosynthesis
MSKIILRSLDCIGKKMAGPGIRYWEFARALARYHEVILFSPHYTMNVSKNLKCLPFSFAALKKEMPTAQFMLSQDYSVSVALLAKKCGVKIVLDAYDPEMIAFLELNKYEPLAKQNQLLKSKVSSILFSMQIADFVICAQKRQKDLLLGLLGALGKINPYLYAENPHLSNLITIVPFGLSKTPPKKTGMGPKEKLGLKETDKLLLWGGGIWNWFDPLTLMHAMSTLCKKRSDIHILFMGIEHPNKDIPKMQMATKAILLAEELNLKDKNVHFHFGWTPYEERQTILLETDTGLSLHFDNLETRFSFRTRILDYLWAKIPIICTEGDVFARLVAKHNLGIVVPYQNPEALAAAIERMVDCPDETATIKANIEIFRKKYTWDKVIIPLLTYMETAPSTFSRWMDQAHVCRAFLKHKDFLSTAKRLWKRLIQSKSS